WVRWTAGCRGGSNSSPPLPRFTKSRDFGCPLRLPLEPLDAGQIHRPRQRRAAPTLARRTQLGAAVERPDPEADRSRVRPRRGGVKRRAAIRAEGVGPLVPALGGLDVDLWRAAFQHEGPGERGYIGAKRGAGQGLAIGTMAHP